jgi:hypothetical protein
MLVIYYIFTRLTARDYLISHYTRNVRICYTPPTDAAAQDRPALLNVINNFSSSKGGVTLLSVRNNII